MGFPLQQIDHEHVIERSQRVSIISLMEGCVGWGDDVNIFLILLNGGEDNMTLSPIIPTPPPTHTPVSQDDPPSEIKLQL